MLEKEYSSDALKYAQDEGYACYLSNGNADDNPYNNNDEWQLNRAWLEGYYNAGWDD